MEVMEQISTTFFAENDFLSSQGTVPTGDVEKSKISYVKSLQDSLCHKLFKSVHCLLKKSYGGVF